MNPAYMAINVMWFCYEIY